MWAPARAFTAARSWRQGTVQDILDNAAAPSRGNIFRWQTVHPVPEKRREPNGGWLTVRGARENNLKNIDVSIPAGRILLRHRRVSGSGKSSLVNEILYKHLAKVLNRARDLSGQIRRHGGRGAAGQDHLHRPEPHRPHPPLQPGYLHRRIRPHPRNSFAMHPGSKGPGLQARTVSPST